MMCFISTRICSTFHLLTTIRASDILCFHASLLVILMPVSEFVCLARSSHAFFFHMRSTALKLWHIDFMQDPFCHVRDLRTLLLLGSLIVTMAFGQSHDSVPVAAADVDGKEMEHQGMEALASHLPDIAVMRFNEALQRLSASDQEGRQRVQLRLAEAMIRAQQPQDALDLLENLKDIPNTRLADVAYWRAHGLAALGKFHEAIEALRTARSDPQMQYHEEAILSQARLCAAIGDLESAVRVLSETPIAKDPQRIIAQLDLARIHLSLGNTEQARKAMPEFQPLVESLSIRARQLLGEILMKEHQYSQAATLFYSLIAEHESNTEPLPANLQASAVLLAEAWLKEGKRSEAIDQLLAFIQNHPNSAHLHTAFACLENLLPENPAPNDPIMMRLRQWSLEPSKPRQLILNQLSDRACDAFPSLSELAAPDLHAHAILLQAKSLRSNPNASSQNERFRLLKRLIWEHPGTEYQSQALLAIAEFHADHQRTELSLSALHGALESASEVRQQQRVLLASAELAIKQNHFADAKNIFEKLQRLSNQINQQQTNLNAGITEILTQDDEALTSRIKQSDPTVQASLKLERALFAAAQHQPEAQTLLDQFLLNHPEHPRVSEARLALAFCAMEHLPPDISLAKAQLDQLALIDPPSAGISLARIRFSELIQQPVQTILLCRAFLEQFPHAVDATSVSMILGSALCENGDLSEARVVWQKLANESPTHAAPARLLAARAAARTGTPQSLQESITLFDQVITSDQPLRFLAITEKARVMLDSKSPDLMMMALKDLDKTWNDPACPSSLRSAVGLLYIESLYALGGSQPTYYQKSLMVQQQLLDSPLLDPAFRLRIHYFKGLTLEQLNQSNDAFATYYDAIESAFNQPPSDWESYDRCAFNALALLEKQNRWLAAIDLAKKIAKAGSPRANEAAERAQRLGLEHMIYDDADAPINRPRAEKP